MALFGTEKKNTDKKAKHVPRARQAKLRDGREHEIIRAPWLSEKALIGTEKGVYVFAVPVSATKSEIAGAIKALYNVDPRQVRTLHLPAKRTALRTRRGTGTRSARHKAYVYLRPGDTIKFA